MTIVYVYPLDARDLFVPNATEWVRSFKEFKPKQDVGIVVCMANGEKNEAAEAIFDGLTVRFIYGQVGGGRDHSAYQFACKHVSGFTLFMNTRTRFWREDWLDRFIEACELYGPNGFYGNSASFQACPLTPTLAPNPHIRSACFATDAETFSQIKEIPENESEGFRFESGDKSITNWYLAREMPAKLVTWDGIYDAAEWRTPPNIFRRGDQTNCLIYDRHHDIYFGSAPDYKLIQEQLADGKVIVPTFA